MEYTTNSTKIHDDITGGVVSISATNTNLRAETALAGELTLGRQEFVKLVENAPVFWFEEIDRVEVTDGEH